jgi:hypothetical protein
MPTQKRSDKNLLIPTLVMALPKPDCKSCGPSICPSPKINILFWHTKVAQSAHDNHLNPAWKSLGRSLTNKKCYHNIYHKKIQANSKLTTIAGGIHKAREMMEM